MSAFDVVMQQPVPDKGRILTAMSVFWFDHLGDIAPNHFLGLSHAGAPDDWAGRMMVVRRAEMLPIECIVRGYLDVINMIRSAVSQTKIVTEFMNKSSCLSVLVSDQELVGYTSHLYLDYPMKQ